MDNVNNFIVISIQMSLPFLFPNGNVLQYMGMTLRERLKSRLDNDQRNDNRVCRRNEGVVNVSEGTFPIF